MEFRAGGLEFVVRFLGSVGSCDRKEISGWYVGMLLDESENYFNLVG
jgi:hypothetical protein